MSSTDSHATSDSSGTTGTYAIDASHSRIGFVARHAMITKVRGSFNSFEGSGHFDPTDPSSITLELTIDVASIDTRNADRDQHVLSNDFLDAETYPTIHFVSTKVVLSGDDTYDVTGDLTIKGVTKSITIEFRYDGAATDLYGNHRIGFEGSAAINRSDFGVTFNAPLETGGVILSDKINLEFDVSAVKS